MIDYVKKLYSDARDEQFDVRYNIEGPEIFKVEVQKYFIILIDVSLVHPRIILIPSFCSRTSRLLCESDNALWVRQCKLAQSIMFHT